MAGLNLNYFIYLLQGAGWTVILSALAFVFGGAAGFLVMLARISRIAAVNRIAMFYVQVIQGIPLLIIIFIIYFGLGILGISMPPLVAAGLALTVYCSAFLGEIWRGSVDAVPRTQTEAAESLALTRWQTLRDVIIPQAAKIATPPTVGFLVQVLKSTSLVSVIGFIELTRAAQVINNTVFQPFTIFGVAGLLYFALCYPLSLWSRVLERRLNVGRR
ncbi:MAG TPA: amino acid ABC transporter permease [Devosia sp.]|nr:amino acid ABC transporter permease [Devosia sp.]